MKKVILGMFLSMFVVTMVLFQFPVSAASVKSLPEFSLFLDCGQQFFANPNGVWSYGWKASRDGVFNLFTNYIRTSQLDCWSSGTDNPSVSYNGTGDIVHNAGTTTLQPGKLILHPGAGGEFSVLRWTAPVSGKFTLSVTFTGVSGYNGAPLTSTDIAVMQNGQTLYSGYLNLNGYGNAVRFTGNLKVNAGEAVDFIVGYGNGTYFYDSTEVDASFYLY